MNDKLKRARGDILLGIGMTAAALFFILESDRIRDGKHVMVSAKLFPRIYAGMLAVCALLILIAGIRNYMSVPKEIRRQKWLTKEKALGLLRVFEVFAVLLATAIFYKRLGFLVVSPIAMFLLFLILEEPSKRRYGLYALLSLVCPVVVFFAFYFLFSNLLPMGVLKNVLINLL